MNKRIFSQRNVSILLMTLGVLQVIVNTWKLLEQQTQAVSQIVLCITVVIVFLILLAWNFLRPQKEKNLFAVVINALVGLLLIFLLAANSFKQNATFLSLLSSLISYSFPIMVGLYLYAQSQHSTNY